jgi:hypothetical protein
MGILNKATHLRLFLLSSLCSLCLCGESPAALDPEVDKPYQLTVVVHVASRPPLTASFAEQIKRELGDSLRAALGDLAQVEITDQHPLLKEVQTKGLQPALEAWQEISEQKTHFVLIDFVDGQYEIQTGQHDGLTGLASPVARRVKTPDRQMVARLAALTIDRDFGVVGTLAPNAKGAEVKVTFKGGALGVPLDHWLAKDGICALAQIKKGSKGLRSFRVEWALLRVTDPPKDGICRCQLIKRYTNPLESGSTVLGYRCLKLAGTTGPLRLRLINDKDRVPLAGRTITINADDFGPKPKEELTTQADGTIHSKEVYQNIAFVRVLDAGRDIQAKFAVAVLDDRIIDCPLKTNKQEEELGDWNSKRKRWQDHVSDSLLTVGELFRELNQFLDKQQIKEALAAAQTGLKALETEDANYREELDELRKTAQAAGGAQAQMLNDLRPGERRLQELQKNRKALADLVTTLNDLLQKAQSPEAKELLTMVETAKNLERQAEFDSAIQMYEKILLKPDAPPSVKTHLQKLQQDWDTKGNKPHEEARKFIYYRWPKMEAATEMKAHLDEVRKAFQICKRAGDHLTPLKLLNTNEALSGKLRKELESDSGKAQTIAEVVEELKKLTEEVSSYIASAKK